MIAFGAIVSELKVHHHTASAEINAKIFRFFSSLTDNINILNPKWFKVQK